MMETWSVKYQENSGKKGFTKLVLNQYSKIYKGIINML